MLTDEQYMNIALTLARRGLGRTWPNPTVGCVIVKNGEIIARGRTGDGGRPHAEAVALQVAGEKAQGAMVYVTLEPCAHHGQTPPCAEALVKAKVAEIIIGCGDIDPRVAGRGIKILADEGIKVTTGVLEKECRDLNAGFFKRLEKGLPFVTLKAAVSADGKYLPGNGAPRWVTSELARKQVQLMRAQHDVIITGTGTVLADNPRLDCRLPGLEIYSPVKVIIGNTPIPDNANIFSGKECWRYDRGELISILRSLAEKGVTRVFIEAGPKLSNAFLEKNLVDEILLFKSHYKIDVGKAFFDNMLFSKHNLVNFENYSEHWLAIYK